MQAEEALRIEAPGAVGAGHPVAAREPRVAVTINGANVSPTQRNSL